MARYGQAFKDRTVARLLPPESSGVADVAREVGINVQTLERWRADALTGPVRDLGSGRRARENRHGRPPPWCWTGSTGARQHSCKPIGGQ